MPLSVGAVVVEGGVTVVATTAGALVEKSASGVAARAISFDGENSVALCKALPIEYCLTSVLNNTRSDACRQAEPYSVVAITGVT